jgi:tRNA A-37 threonylcarbamoyl transferase component Bud32
MSNRYQSDRYGEFAAESRDVAGWIRLKGDERRTLEDELRKFRREAKLWTSTIVGVPIAATYGIRVNNFSTQTRIISLPSGRKVFLVYCHVGSVLHRLLDGLMKLLAGLFMCKVRRGRWQRRFEERSQIPPFVLSSGLRNIMAMPFIPNVNAYDAFRRPAELAGLPKGFGWVKELDAAQKLRTADLIAKTLADYHRRGLNWGEVILPNIILDAEGRPTICDPEVEYFASVAPLEARARDLRDLTLSVAAVLKQTDDVSYAITASRLMSAYGDREVATELHRLAVRPRRWWQKLAVGYEMARTGAKSGREYDDILAAIVSSSNK